MCIPREDIIDRQIPNDRRRQIRIQQKRERKRLRALRARKRSRRARTAATAPEGYLDIVQYYAARVGLQPTQRRSLERAILFPKRFSFIEAPNEAIDVLNGLVKVGLLKRTQTIDLMQESCQLIDHCAESAAAVMARQLRGRFGVRFRGTFPKAEKQRVIVHATGLPRMLDIDLPTPEGFIAFPLRRGRQAGSRATVSSQKEIEAGNVTKHVDDCLGEYNWGLTDEAKEYLSRLIGEVLDNAEEHSGRPDWWIAGYLRKDTETKYGDYHLTIFNFGRTLSESLQELSPGSELRKGIQSLIRKHRGGLFSASWTEENLWTLYALQGGVSRLEGDRGTGTVDMIRFFERIGQQKSGKDGPVMCVVSGRTQILFDGKYGMKYQRIPSGEKRFIIAFNKTNDLRRKPDPNCVRNLDRYFPGTLISLRIFFDQEHLERIGGS